MLAQADWRVFFILIFLLALWDFFQEKYQSLCIVLNVSFMLFAYHYIQ